MNLDIDFWKTCDIALVKCFYLLPKAQMFSLGGKYERSYAVTLYSVLLERNVCHRVKNAWKCTSMHTAGTARGVC